MYLYEDSCESREKVDALNSFLESNYPKLKTGKKQPEFMNLAKEAAKWDSKIIELLVANLEHDFNGGILLRFFSIFIFPVIAFLGSGAIYQNINIHQDYFVGKIPKEAVQYFATALTTFFAYRFFDTNLKKNDFLLILRYALIMKRYPENVQIEIKNEVQHLD
jgi:hypothetical protein